MGLRPFMSYEHLPHRCLLSSSDVEPEATSTFLMDQCSRHVIPPVVGGPPHRPASARSNPKARRLGPHSADLPAARPQPVGFDPRGGGPPLGPTNGDVLGVGGEGAEVTKVPAENGTTRL